MKFSIFSLMQWPKARSARDAFRNELDQLTRAEAQGYDCAWLAEHHFSAEGIGPSIHLSAANLAARTRTIRIGTAVTILPFMHPLRVAEEVAMLDILSEGRIEWAIGRGYQGHEFEGFGVDLDKSHELFYEQLEIIKKAWTGQPFAHAGEFYEFDELRCFPSPIQEPRPPMHIATRGDGTIEWAAHNHYPVLTDPFTPVEELGTNRKRYIEAAATVEVDASALEIATVRQVYVGASMQKAREEVTPGLLGYYRSDSDEDPEALLKFVFDECAIIGDEAYCRDRIAELQETIGLAQLICWQNFGNLSHEQALASQERLIAQVAPAFA